MANEDLPLVSVIMPAHNSQRTIGESITSVLNQSFPNLELIIIDDDSTDGTREVVFGFKDDRIKYLYQEHAERSNARNNGILHARGEYIAFVDSDDLWMPEKLEKQLALFEANPDLGLVYSDSFFFDDQTGKDINISSRMVKQRNGHVWKHLLLSKNFIPSPTPIIPKKIFDLIGGFDPELPPVEDLDMWVRIAYHSPIDLIPEPIARYRMHSKMTAWRNPSINIYQSSLKLLDKAEKQWARDDWVLQRQINMRRARIHYMYGVGKLRERNFKLAKVSFRASFCRNPLYPKTYIRWMQLYFLHFITKLWVSPWKKNPK